MLDVRYNVKIAENSSIKLTKTLQKKGGWYRELRITPAQGFA